MHPENAFAQPTIKLLLLPQFYDFPFLIKGLLDVTIFLALHAKDFDKVAPSHFRR